MSKLQKAIAAIEAVQNKTRKIETDVVNRLVIGLSPRASKCVGNTLLGAGLGYLIITPFNFGHGTTAVFTFTSAIAHLLLGAVFRDWARLKIALGLGEPGDGIHGKN